MFSNHSLYNLYSASKLKVYKVQLLRKIYPIIPCSVCAIDLGVDGAVVVTKAEDSETLTVVRILISYPSAQKF